jgi:protein-S-isoprenylcysteine O-methyltransferase Ste14
LPKGALVNPVLRRVLFLLWAVAAAGMYAVILFALAGRLDLPMMWAYVGVTAALMVTGMALADPELLKERIRPGRGAKGRLRVALLRLVSLVHLILAALDVGRLHWSDTVPIGLQAAALIGFAAGYGFVIWAGIVNPFFSSVVRLQDDRGHYVVSTGPYRVVRHPGYTGVIFAILCSPLALGSWLSLLPAAVFDLLILRRTVLEDRFLHEQLDGYPDYARRVPWRLVPGLW